LLPAAAGGEAPAPPFTAGPAAKEESFNVLCYHRFVDRGVDPKSAGSAYLLPLAEFRWELGYLRDHGITPVSLDQVKAYWFQGGHLPPKAVLLTFDDGFKSIYEKAYPVMKEFGYPAVLFLYTDFIRAQAESLKYADIEEMGKTGWALESHTKSHMNLGMEGEKRGRKAFRDLLTRELSDPLGFIKEKYGRQATVLAYPYGVYDEEVLQQTEKLGYQLAFTVNPGPNDRSVPPLKLKRNLIQFPESHKSFERIFTEKVLHLGRFFPGDGEFITDKRPRITAEIKDDVVPKTVQLRLGERVLPVHYDPKSRRLWHQPAGELKPGGHMLILTARDSRGIPRTYSWYFRLKHRKWNKFEKEQNGGPEKSIQVKRKTSL
jgi:peptidoglycan/xylan/chitin deacetylase (PgdA/CDA1 family)